jgi:hypothetical protein
MGLGSCRADGSSRCNYDFKVLENAECCGLIEFGPK